MTTPSVTIGSLVRRYRYLLVALALLILGTVAAIASPPSRDFTWSASSLAPTVIAGGASVTTTVSFTDTGKLPLADAEVQLSPSLAGLVSVLPTHLGTVKQGQTVTLTLTASAPASSTPTVVQGSIQVLKQQSPVREVYGAPLQVNLNVKWPTFPDPANAYSVGYPPSFTPTYDATYGDLLLQPQQSESGTEEAPGITISREPNPQNLTVPQYFNGTNGPDLVGQSLGIFSTSTLPSGALAYTFDPVVTFAGGLTVVVPRALEFVVVSGQAIPTGTLQTVLNSLTVN